eukprot:1185770-Prorocentrum_minimum.AAC.1
MDQGRGGILSAIDKRRTRRVGMICSSTSVFLEERTNRGHYVSIDEAGGLQLCFHARNIMM